MTQLSDMHPFIPTPDMLIHRNAITRERQHIRRLIKRLRTKRTATGLATLRQHIWRLRWHQARACFRTGPLSFRGMQDRS